MSRPSTYDPPFLPHGAPTAPAPPSRRLRLLAWRGRWWLVLAAVALAARLIIPVAVPDAVPSSRVAVAARDIAAGAEVTTGDITIEKVPSAIVPDSAFGDAGALPGRVAAVGVPQGHVLTEEALMGSGLAAETSAGTVIAPVPLADARLLAVLSPGVQVDVLAADGLGGPAVVVAKGARVAGAPLSDQDDNAATVLVQVSPDEARAMAGAQAHAALSVVLVG